MSGAALSDATATVVGRAAYGVDGGDGTHGLGRGTLGWLLLAQVLVVLPLLRELTLWMLPVCAIGVAWRIAVHLGRAGLPPLGVKFLLVLLALAAVVVGYGTAVGLEPAVTLLVSAYYLKLLEIRRQRDLHIVVNLSFFLLGIVFIFDQTLPIAIYVALVTAVVFSVLVQQGQAGSELNWHAPLGRSARLLLHAIPMTVLLFVFFPRAAPLWSVPMPTGTSQTGLTETMSVRQITELGRSGELAFRVTFEGEPPPRRALYWRSLTYSEYRDGQWSQPDLRSFRGGLGPLVSWGGRQPARWLREVHDTRRLRYNVIAEPHNQLWLYALDAPHLPRRGLGVGRDFRVLSGTPVTATFGYELESSLTYRYDPELPTWLAAMTLQLPREENPRTLALGRQLRAESESPQAFVQRVLRLFADEPFQYTLEPTAFDRDEVDGFLFESRRGFCAHYAGAFVLLMRAGNVPARLVGGYQGGAWRQNGEYLSVYQYDAHAWAEVWLRDRGWVRIDPTQVVAPERIQLGMTDALDRVEGFLGDSEDVTTRHRLRRAFRSVLEFIESIDHRWNIWVVGFDRETQTSWLRALLGRTDVLTVAVVLLVGAALVFAALGGGPLLLRMIRARLGVPPEIRLARELDRLGMRLGVPRRPAEPVRCYALRLAQARPAHAAPLAQIAASLQQLLYDPGLPDRGSRLGDVHRLLSQLRRRTLLDGFRGAARP